jgi:hypothetical protein
MSLVPQSKDGRIEFFEERISPWTTNHAAIGTTAGAVTDLETKTTAARAAYQAQKAAQNTAKAATETLKDAVDAMFTAGSNIIKEIRTQAAKTGNSVYALAQIPAPALPSRLAPPGTPTDLTVTLNGDGTLILGFGCENPVGSTGTMYQVFRSNNGSNGDFIYLGGTGEKRFTDETVPAGATSLTYKIQAVRSTAAGMWATFNVFFGANANGQMTASVTDTTPKIAA